MSSSSSSDSNDGPSESSRKRQRTPGQWKKNVAKKKRNLGQAYESGEPSGGHVAARTIGLPCRCGCFEKVGRENVQQVFSEFWALGDFNLQNEYLASVIKSIDVARSRVKERPSRRKRSVTYNVKCQSELISVCAVAFRNIHGIGERRVRTVLDKVSSTGIVEKD